MRSKFAVLGTVLVLALAFMLTESAAASPGSPGTVGSQPADELVLYAALEPRADGLAALAKALRAEVLIWKLRFGGDSSTGEYTLQSGEGIASAVAEAQRTFAVNGLAVPPLIGFYVVASIINPGDDPAARLRHLLGDDLTDVTAVGRSRDRSTVVPEERGPQATGVFPSWSPSKLQVFTSRVVSYYPQRSDIEFWFSWDNMRGYNANSMPPDWGVEIELNLYGEQPPGFRPACVPGFGTWDAEQGFWSSTENISWVTALPAESEPYLDDNRLSDACDRNALSAGIGKPRAIVRSAYLYGFYIQNELGNQPSSPMSANVQAVSNDCNDLHVAANSDCMGLNEKRDFPGPGVANQTYVNEKRNWTVPGCVQMEAGWTGPVRWANGTTGPPQTHYYHCLPTEQ